MNFSRTIFTTSLILTTIHFVVIDAMIAHFGGRNMPLPNEFMGYMAYTTVMPTILVISALLSGYWSGARAASLALCAMIAASNQGLFFQPALVDIIALMSWAAICHLVIGFTSNKTLGSRM